MQADRLRHDRRVALVVDCLAIHQAKARSAATASSSPSSTSNEDNGSSNLSRPSKNRNSGIGSGASSAAWTISGSAAGWSFAASSMASAKVFATVQLVVIVEPARPFRRRAARSARREAPRIIGEGDVEPLAISRGLFVGERQAAERLRKRLRLGALARGRCARSDNRRRFPWPQLQIRSARRVPRQSGALEVTSTRAAPPLGRIGLSASASPRYRRSAGAPRPHAAAAP